MLASMAVGLLSALLTSSAMPALFTAELRRCATAPLPAAVVARDPWPQQRYDLAALGRISEGDGVTVAVIDSGVDAHHPQLAGAVLAGVDLLRSENDAREDCVGHGTAVASIIAARPAAGAGLRGLAPRARILPVRVSERAGTASGSGGVAQLAAGIRAAIASRPRPAVINLSISTPEDSPPLRAAVREALAADIVVVAAVGNNHGASANPQAADPTPYPAAYPGVVGVGGMGPDGQRSPSSQVGPYVDLVAPGDDVIGASPGGGHVTVRGTSFAAAFVAGTAALIRARWPNLSRAEVVRRLLVTADPAPGPRAEYGYGILNPLRALTELVPASGPDPDRRAALPDATSPTGPEALPRAHSAPSPPTGLRRTPSLSALGVAAALVVAAGGLAAVAAAVPAARRRRWRPGTGR